MERCTKDSKWRQKQTVCDGAVFSKAEKGKTVQLIVPGTWLNRIISFGYFDPGNVITQEVSWVWLWYSTLNMPRVMGVFRLGIHETATLTQKYNTDNNPLMTRKLKCHHHHHHHHHYPSSQLAYWAATKLLHPCLSLTSLWMVPQLWFIFFISASTVLLQIVFGRPCFHFLSGVQWIATSVMKLASLRSTCRIQYHRFLVMMVSMSSCWHRAKRSRSEIVFGQKMRWIFLRQIEKYPQGISFVTWSVFFRYCMFVFRHGACRHARHYSQHVVGAQRSSSKHFEVRNNSLPTLAGINRW